MKAKILLLTLYFFCESLYYESIAQNNFSAINHIVHMGQSLGAGEQSLPVVTGTDPGYGNLMFAMGTHTWSDQYFASQPERRAYRHFSFVPLRAQQRGGEGETIANGMCDHLRIAISKRTGISEAPKFLFSYAGQGGRYLRELNKRHDDAKDPRAGARRSNGGYYQTSIDDVRRAKYVADSLGLSYSVLAVTWMQGEANGTGKLNRWGSSLSRPDFLEAYQKDLIDIKNDYQEDIRAITDQKQNPSFFTYQTAGNMSGIAQWNVCNEEDDMFMIGPTYMLPNAENSYYKTGKQWRTGDGIHLTADGERWLGEQFGKVIKRVVADGQNWKPLQPENATFSRNEKTILVDFHVPVGSIVIDTSFLPPQGKGLGFDVYDDEGRRYDVDKVKIVSSTALRITLKVKPGEERKLFLQYGQHSYVYDVSRPISNIRFKDEGDTRGQQLELIFEGDLLNEFAPLMQEGVFYVSNRVAHDSLSTNVIVRQVYVNQEGNTVLSGFTKDLRKGVPFLEGQRCYVMRRYAYGNVRDQDDEQSVYTFEDPSYGTRHGQPYPLWNWCVGFTDFPIK